jgi:CrcB protein
MLYFWVGVGSAIGGVTRMMVSQWATAATGPGFPWGTVFINVTGSLAIGFFMALTGADGRPFSFSPAGQVVTVGVLGGYTTFSAFSAQTLGLLQQGQAGAALFNMVFPVVAGLAAVWLGFLAGATVARTGAF